MKTSNTFCVDDFTRCLSRLSLCKTLTICLPLDNTLPVYQFAAYSLQDHYYAEAYPYRRFGWWDDILPYRAFSQFHSAVRPGDRVARVDSCYFTAFFVLTFRAKSHRLATKLPYPLPPPPRRAVIYRCLSTSRKYPLYVETICLYARQATAALSAKKTRFYRERQET